MNTLPEWIDTTRSKHHLDNATYSESAAFNLDPARRIIKSGISIPPVEHLALSPHFILSQLVACCIDFALLLHCLDGPGEMGDWDNEEAGARSACVPSIHRQRRLTCSSRLQYQPKRCTKPGMPRAGRKSRRP